MIPTHRCDRCGHELARLRKPVRSLRWTKYWGKGFQSLLTGPLLHCRQCGALYASNGDLLAAGALETEAERRINTFRRDMAIVRDSFAGVIVAAAVVTAWLAGSPTVGTTGQVILTGSVGAVSVLPYLYFFRKARLAKRELKQLRQARREGARLEAGGGGRVG